MPKKYTFLENCLGFSRLAVITILITLSGALSGPAMAQSDDYTSAYIGYHLNNFEYAEKIWTELANDGDMNSQYALGVMQLRGESKNSSPEKAYQWFLLAAKKGHSTAMFNVGVALWEGSGVEQDREEALEWWQQSAEKGDSGAQFNLGLAYYLGEILPRDIDTAAKWISKAEQKNHPEANRVLQAIMDENPKIAAQLKDRPKPDPNQTPTNGAIARPVEPTQGENATVANTQSDSTTVNTTAPSGGNTYWKTSVSTQVRSSPKTNAPAFLDLPVDTPVEILQTRGSWSKLTLPTGLKTWIYNKYLTVEDQTGTIKGSGVRVRPKASTNNTTSPPLGIYREGDKVRVLNRYENWTQIRAPKYIGGWVATKDLTKYQDSEENRQALWDKKISEGL